MDKITSNQYIKLQRKICNAKVVIAVHQLSADWGVSPADVCYRIICEQAIKEVQRKKDLHSNLSAFNK